MRHQRFDSQQQKRWLLADIHLVHNDRVGAAAHVKQEVLEAGQQGVVIFYLSGHPEVRLTDVGCQTGVIEPLRDVAAAVRHEDVIAVNVQNLLLAVPVGRAGSHFSPEAFGRDKNLLMSTFVLVDVPRDDDEDKEVDHSQ